MKKFIFVLVAVSTLLFACKKDDDSNTKTVQLNETFSLKVNQTAELNGNDWSIKLLAITEDSRCPASVDCLLPGRVVAEFIVSKDGKSLIKSLTDNPGNDFTISTAFEAFGQVVKLVEVTPYPEDFEQIPQKDYVVKLEIE